MLINQKLGNLKDYETGERVIDRLPVEWYETSKRILHKRSGAGKEIILKFMKESPQLEQDDVLYADDRSLVVVEILACDAITVFPSSLYDMAYLCYEIGNKHLPLFFENDALLIPFDAPLYRQLITSGFEPVQEKRKLLRPIRTSVAPHSHGSGTSLFTKILQRTTSPNA